MKLTATFPRILHVLTLAVEGSRERKSRHTNPDNHSGGEKKLPCTKLRLSEFLQSLNDLGTLFTLMYYELPFSSLYKDTQFLKSSLQKKDSTFSVISICTFLLQNDTATDLLDLPLFCLYVLFMGSTGSNLCI